MCADTPPAIVLVLVVVLVLDASVAFALRARTVPGPFFSSGGFRMTTSTSTISGRNIHNCMGERRRLGSVLAYEINRGDERSALRDVLGCSGALPYQSRTTTRTIYAFSLLVRSESFLHQDFPGRS